MKQETINLYKFEELKEDVKQKVIEKYRDINVDYSGWDDFILDEWNAKLKGLGFEEAKILYSGFGSQGDGACFTATVNIEKYLSAHKLRTKFKGILKCADDISISITHSWRYYFASSTDVKIEYYGDDPKMEGLLDELEKIIRCERETLGNQIYKDLDREYFDLISDECVEESIKANDYDFLENGDSFRHKIVSQTI